jgi:hypothetical protein
MGLFDNPQIVAVIIQEGSRIASEMLRARGPSKLKSEPVDLEQFVMDTPNRFPSLQTKPTISIVAEQPAEQSPSTAVININTETSIVKSPQVEVADGKAKDIATGCVPCAMGHFGTCSGILNESIRFAKGADGMASPEVIDRVNMCLDELNAMERVDLRPEMTVQLEGWQKELADKALAESRSIRHTLEGIHSYEDLEKVAARTQTSRKAIGREWFKNALPNMSPEDKEEVKRRVLAKIEAMAAAEE